MTLPEMTLAELLNQNIDKQEITNVQNIDKQEITNVLLQYIQEVEPQEREATLQALRSRTVPGQGKVVELTGIRAVLIKWKELLLRGVPTIALIFMTGATPSPEPKPSSPPPNVILIQANLIEEGVPPNIDYTSLVKAALMALIALQTLRDISTITLGDKHAKIAIEIWKTHEQEEQIDLESFKQEIKSKISEISAEDFEVIIEDFMTLGIIELAQGTQIGIVKREPFLSP